MKKIRVLVVDDDIAMSKLLHANFKARGGFDVYTAMSGKDALAMLEREPFDLMILDIVMPGMDGLEVCRRVREWSKVPIIMLSAKEGEKDKVRCFELGADDYITKPFGIDELMARVKAALRHAGNGQVEPAKCVLSYGDIEIDLPARIVKSGGKEVNLTPIEYRLLQEFTTNANKVLTHQSLLYKVWGNEYGDDREYLRVYINRLRKKLSDDSQTPRRIVTVPAVGYRFVTS